MRNRLKRDGGALTVTLLIMAALVGLFLLSWYGLEMRRFFAPRAEQVRFETFQRSGSRIEGQLQALTRTRAQYTGADTEEHRCALRSVALQEAAVTDRETLSESLNDWITELEEDTTCVD